MTPEELLKDAREAKAQGAHCGVTLVFRRGQKRPQGFPRGELLCETDRGKVYSFDPDRIIRWLENKGLVQD